MPVEKDGSRIRRMFAEISPRYDLLNHLLSLSADKAWRRRAVRELKLRQGGKVLDVCTGTGDLALELSGALEALGDGSVIGADFTPEMVRLAEAKRLKRRQENLSFLLADALNLPFLDRTFDAVTVAFGIRNVSNLELGLDEIFRVLKPGGKAAILEFATLQSPLLKRPFEFYFRHILPRIGQWVAPRGGKYAYSYLTASVEEFPSLFEFSRLLEARGFTAVRSRKLTLGVSALYLGTRPLPQPVALAPQREK